jgi:hypothetical protein
VRKEEALSYRRNPSKSSRSWGSATSAVLVFVTGKTVSTARDERLAPAKPA